MSSQVQILKGKHLEMSTTLATLENLSQHMELILQRELLICDQCLDISPRSGVHVRGGSD